MSSAPSPDEAPGRGRCAGRLARATLAFLALPGIVAITLPLVLARGMGLRHPGGFPALAAGLALLLWCIAEFYREGRGTLAPWDPPRRLVTSGPYRYSRNPMYLAVTTILVAWAILFASRLHALYALAVALGFELSVLCYEEPALARTHAQFAQYRDRVPRWLL
jgi:protein-S-isoprenylcysteine O-methyltransferase Ste14